eukprot:gene11994-14015_t
MTDNKNKRKYNNKKTPQSIKKRKEALESDKKSTPTCPLCDGKETSFYSDAFNKTYFSCATCSLVFLLSSAADKRYLDFLRPAVDIMLPLLPKDDADKATLRGLDYGCGPGPALSVMFGENGYTVENYDPYFMPNKTVELALEKGTTDTPYDFITCTEAIEHFRYPKEDLVKMFTKGLIKPGGQVLFMTQFVRDTINFSEWHYPRDITHVCFFPVSTFQWIANHYKRLRRPTALHPDLDVGRCDTKRIRYLGPEREPIEEKKIQSL